MDQTISRSSALKLINNNVTKKNVLFHMLAVESIMRGAAKSLGENEEQWGLVGLLHDVDYEKTAMTPEKHSLLSEEILKGIITEDIIRAIKSHNAAYTGIVPISKMEKALVASDAISGLLVACARVTPSKKISDVKAESVAKKFGHKDFARGVDRRRIMACEEIGIPRDEFFQMALSALKEIATEIRL